MLLSLEEVVIPARREDAERGIAPGADLTQGSEFGARPEVLWQSDLHTAAGLQSGLCPRAAGAPPEQRRCIHSWTEPRRRLRRLGRAKPIS